MTDLPDRLAQLQSKLKLDSAVVAAAERKWRQSAEAIVDGLVDRGTDTEIPFSDFSNLRQRYLCIARYCRDARRLIEFHDTTEEPDEAQFRHVFAVDPHMLRAYSEPWDPDNHTGFDFFSGESTALETDDGPRLPVFVYNTLFSPDKDVTILDAGRSELSAMFGFFEARATQERTVNGGASGGLYSARDFLADLKKAYLDQDGDNDRSKLTTAFDRLMMVGGGTHLRQRMALARLVDVMKTSKFQTTESSLRQSLRKAGSGDEKTKEFSTLLRFIRNNPSFLNEARRRLTDAYVRFRRVDAELHRVHNSRKQNPEILRGGELDDLNALLEVHVINTCLAHLDLNVRVSYVTLSTRLFDFTRQIDESVLRVPLIHPRSAMMLEDSGLFQECREAMTQVVANAIAFGATIPDDQEISPTEIDLFEAKLGKPLEIIRDTFFHAAADSDNDRARMTEALRLVFNNEDFSEDERHIVERVLKAIEPTLKRQVQYVKSEIKKNSGGLAQEAWDAYLSFAETEEHKKAIDIVWRRYRSGDTNRYACLPLGGSYRYMFVLHNQSLDTELAHLSDGPDNKKNDGGRFACENIDWFMKQVAANGTRDTGGDENLAALVRRKNQALQYFMRAIFAASYRQWTLAHSLATQAHNALNEGDTNVENIESALGKARCRAAQIDQETLFLRHLCRRAVAEASEPGRPRLTWLKRAAADLSRSAELTQCVPRTMGSFSSGVNPVSLRQALAFVGLQIAWAVLQRELDLSDVLQSLPKANDSAIAWFGLEAFETAGNPSTKMLSDACVKLGEVIATELNNLRSDADGPDEGEHSMEYWRYFLLRSQSMDLLIQTSGHVGLIIGHDRYATIDDLHKIVNLHRDHRRWIEGERDRAYNKRRNTDAKRDQNSEDANDKSYVNVRDIQYRDIKTDPNPFFRALLSAASIRLNAIYDDKEETWEIGTPSELFGAFARMDANCNALDLFGFPRQVIRAVKKEYADAVAYQIGKEYLDYLRK